MSLSLSSLRSTPARLSRPLPPSPHEPPLLLHQPGLVPVLPRQVGQCLRVRSKVVGAGRHAGLEAHKVLEGRCTPAIENLISKRLWSVSAMPMLWMTGAKIHSTSRPVGSDNRFDPNEARFDTLRRMCLLHVVRNTSRARIKTKVRAGNLQRLLDNRCERE